MTLGWCVFEDSTAPYIQGRSQNQPRHSKCRPCPLLFDCKGDTLPGSSTNRADSEGREVMPDDATMPRRSFLGAGLASMAIAGITAKASADDSSTPFVLKETAGL